MERRLAFLALVIGLGTLGCGDDGGGSPDAAVSFDATAAIDADTSVCGDGTVSGNEVCDTALSVCCASDCESAKSAGDSCRPAADNCDLAETCDGTGYECPDEAYAVSGTECALATGQCDLADTCDGAGSCVPSSAAANGTSCDTCAAGPCECIEATCSGLLTSCNEIKAAFPMAPDGAYTIDDDGVGGVDPFDVYCNMTIDGGGWTLVDNDALTAETFSSREAGANADFTLTRGSILPAYTWSDTPRVLCISERFTDGAAENWITLEPTNAEAMTYPTSATGTGFSDTWALGELNGNTNMGTSSYTFVTTFGNFGALWVGNSANPTCACNYSTSSLTAIGSVDILGNTTTCSTWVR